MAQGDRRFSWFLRDLFEPVRHPHLAIHRSGGRQVLSGFRIIAGPTVQLAEAEVAVGDERTHPKLIGPGESLAVLRVCGLQVKRVGRSRRP